MKIYDNAPKDSSCAIDKTTIRNTRTGYYMRKYDKHTSSYETPVTGYVRRFRLAELYLNFAEAEVTKHTNFIKNMDKEDLAFYKK